MEQTRSGCEADAEIGMGERLQLGSWEDPAIVPGRDSGDLTKKPGGGDGKEWTGPMYRRKFSRSGDGMDWGRGTEASSFLPRG